VIPRQLRLALATLCVWASAASAAPTGLDSARVVFQRNVDAIRNQNLEAYLACYLPTDTLVRTSPVGFTLGYKSLAESAGSWPTVYEAHDLRLTPVRDGVVYGTYRYRVRFGEVEHAGISERLFVRTAAGWKVAMTTAFDAPPGTPPPPRAIVGATLIDGTGAAPVRDAVVVLRDGKIEASGSRSAVPIPAGVDTLDARGTWILPGLADAHVHFSQTGWADGRPDALDVRDLHPYEATIERLRTHPETFFRSWLACGVTSVFDVGGYAWTVGLEERTRLDTEAPRVVATGPLLSTLDHWLNLPGEQQFIHLNSDSIARACVHYLKSLGSSAIKVWFINVPGRDFDAMAKAVAAAGDEARKVGLPLLVHATGLREAKAALRAKPNLLVHSVWDLPVDQEFLDLARAAGTVYCPTITVIDGYWRMQDALRTGVEPQVDDPNGVVDSLTRAHVASLAQLGARKGNTTPDSVRKARRQTMAANLLKVHKAGIPVAMGTDAGNPLTLHGPAVYAEMEAMQRAGMSAMEVIVASTRNSTRAMGLGESVGIIAPGRGADLIVVGADPTRDVANLRRLRWVVRDGVIRPASEFKARQ
jgi:imidazolonepropionase-like amidohydrolase